MEFTVVIDNEYLPDTMEFTFDDVREAMSFAILAKKHSDDGALVSVEVLEKEEKEDDNANT